MTTKTLDVLVAGELFADIIMSGFPSWPQPGEEAIASHLWREIGGGAAITACGLARLGAKAGVLGVVGSDVGSWVTEGLRERGVDTSRIHYDTDRPTALTVAISSPQDRAFFTHPGANVEFPAVLMQAATEGLLSQARHVHLAYPPALDTAPELVQALRMNDCSVSLDVGWRENWLRDSRAMALVRDLDIFFPNEREAACMTRQSEPGAMLEAYARGGCKAVALKLGTRGAALLWHGNISFVEPYAVEPVDTTGAGDSFDAGFLYGMLKGEDPQRCLHIGNICGALSTRALGGIASFPASTELWLEK